MRIRQLITTATLTIAATALYGIAPAGAQQLVDAGSPDHDGSGGLAFVIFATVCMTIAGSLFFMDRVRRRASDDETPAL